MSKPIFVDHFSFMFTAEVENNLRLTLRMEQSGNIGNSVLVCTEGFPPGRIVERSLRNVLYEAFEAPLQCSFSSSSDLWYDDI